MLKPSPSYLTMFFRIKEFYNRLYYVKLRYFFIILFLELSFLNKTKQYKTIFHTIGHLSTDWWYIRMKFIRYLTSPVEI